MTEPGFHLVRTDENVDEVDALAAAVGGRAGLGAVLADLPRRVRRWWVPARAVHRAWRFDGADQRDVRWWPQGVSSSEDASFGGDADGVAGRRVVAVAWYAKNLPGGGRQGSRVTFVDLGARRYRHVLLVVPTLRDGVAGLEPLHVHAGGIVWCGGYLHVAATARGFYTCRTADVLRMPDDSPLDTFGYRYVLPARFQYQAVTDDGAERLRYSFMSLDRESDPPALVVGEYGRGTGRTRRLTRFPLDPTTMLPATAEDGAVRPLGLEDGVGQMQGAVVARGRLHVTTSHGPWTPGSVHTGPAGTELARHRWATPMGPEDLAYLPSSDELLSVTEHPLRRWVFTMKRSWFE